MSLEDEYLGRITPGEAREAHSRAESDCEHMPSAAWRALHAVGQMRYEYAVQLPSGEWVRESDEGTLALTIDPMRALRRHHPRTIERLGEVASAQFGCECRIVRRLVSEPEVVE